MGLCPSLCFQPLGRWYFVGTAAWMSFPSGAIQGADTFSGSKKAARHHVSLQVFSELLAWRLAAFHCCLFICVNSLRFLSCSLQGTEGELVPADCPIRSTRLCWSEGWKRGMEAKVSPTPPGPRVPPACCFPANTVSVQPKNVSLIS